MKRLRNHGAHREPLRNRRTDPPRTAQPRGALAEGRRSTSFCSRPSPISSPTMLYPVAYNIRMSLDDVNIRTFLSGDAPFVGLRQLPDAGQRPGVPARDRALADLYRRLAPLPVHDRLRAGALLQPALPRQRRPARALPARLAAADRGQRQHLPLDARWRLRRAQLRPAASSA